MAFKNTIHPIHATMGDSTFPAIGTLPAFSSDGHPKTVIRHMTAPTFTYKTPNLSWSERYGLYGRHVFVPV